MTVINMQEERVSNYLALATARARLKIEIATGLSHSRGSTLTTINRAFGTTFKRKQQALDWVNERLAALRTENEEKQP